MKVLMLMLTLLLLTGCATKDDVFVANEDSLNVVFETIKGMPNDEEAAAQIGANVQVGNLPSKASMFTLLVNHYVKVGSITRKDGDRYIRLYNKSGRSIQFNETINGAQIKVF